jgi:hypothetical protein
VVDVTYDDITNSLIEEIEDLLESFGESFTDEKFRVLFIRDQDNGG